MTDLSAAVTDVSRVLDLTGVLANAILGGMVARGHRFDPIGFATLAIVSGLGGGLVRDTLLQRGTPVALTDPAYVVTALVGAGIAFVLPMQGPTWERVFPWVDALALGSWAAAGASRTLAFGLGWLPAVLLGTVTAVGGGTVRDLMVHRIPSVFGGNTLYATSAALASGAMVLLTGLGFPTVGLAAAMVVGAGLTLVARWRGWTLPRPYAWSLPAVRVPRHASRRSDQQGGHPRHRARHVTAGKRPAEEPATGSRRGRRRRTRQHADGQGPATSG